MEPQVVLPPMNVTSSSTASLTSSGSTLITSDPAVGGQDEGTDSLMRDQIGIKPQAPGQNICKYCGKEIDDPEEKNIPSNVAWLSFSFLFLCCLWWLSWVPFIVDNKRCNICKTAVKVCPHCYRRIDRPPV
ncbi:uncharacterized protein LOC118432877 [Folsomia candida]|uniref:LITAF domain-containing protein n=1 Tax=Folsomia candida TaxID=158441 RepID=A0A226D971_FOLCA|nr:uncharacterized protein LOC118432877 [Folsomia candida]OXA41693.1 hypothetical protein Fcan01_23517 [Folsomia candida]